MRITFLGGVEGVSGSRFLVEGAGQRVLVDCGLFQGYKNLRLLNWKPFPVPRASIDAVLLTHAHVDHSGYLPVLVREGFRGPVHCSQGTADLARILLLDAAKLSEEDARLANERGYSRHRPAVPLFTAKDAEAALVRFHPWSTGVVHRLRGGMRVQLVPNGHILGSTCIVLDDGEERVLFSGDVGRSDDVVMPAPQPAPAADRVVAEATYGDRAHPPGDVGAELAGEVRRAARTRGVLLIPAFAVGRAQAVLVLLHRLMRDRKAPRLPIVVDSPMAEEASRLLFHNAALTRLTREECREVEARAEWVGDADASRALGRRRGPFVLVSASGMLTGGRVLHHLERVTRHPRNTVLLVGHQAGGTRGARLAAGERVLKVHGRQVEVRARIRLLEGLSAHVDAREMLAWLRPLAAPRATYLVHGEPAAADAMRRRVQEELGWACEVPRFGDAR